MGYHPKNDAATPVEDIAAYARLKRISTEEAQDLFDRVGSDRDALDEAVDILQCEDRHD